MPEYPDVELYLAALRTHIVGRRLSRVIVRSPFLLRTHDPPLSAVEGRDVRAVSRLGKRILWHFDDELCLVFHLMVTGRFHRKRAGVLPRGKFDLAAFQFDQLVLMLTETAKKKQASLHLVRGAAAIAAFDRGGLDVMTCPFEDFADRLQRQNRIVKLALIDPQLLDGIGNAYSDEILHRARLSPYARTGTMTGETLRRLFEAVRETLIAWRDRLIAGNGDGFPETVTAFREGMAVHGRFGQPCPDCGRPVQRIVFADRQWNYCAKCQTGGRRLADRSLSRLLRDDWPSDIDGES